MNGYEKRKQLRQRTVDKRKRERAYEDAVLRDKLLERYERAYEAYYKRPCRAYYVTGWFTVHHRKVREGRFVEMTERLEALLHEQELNTPEQSL